MKLSELIAHVGDENIQVQNLVESMESINKGTMGKATMITFGTNAITPQDLLVKPQKLLGLVIWIPRDKMPKTS